MPMVAKTMLMAKRQHKWQKNNGGISAINNGNGMLATKVAVQ